MSVAELIELLEDLDQDSEIGYDDCEFGWQEIDDIIDNGSHYTIQ